MAPPVLIQLYFACPGLDLPELIYWPDLTQSHILQPKNINVFQLDSKIYWLTMVRRYYAVAPKMGRVMLPNFVVYPSPTVPDHR